MSDAPIFILGANRSGTTLLRLMLNAHSRIAVPEEMLYFRSSYAGVPVENWREPKLSEKAYAGIVRDFVANACALHEELDGAAIEASVLNGSARDLRTPYSAVMSAWADSQQKARWGEKTPGNLFYVDVILEMYPDAKFVYLARDPRAGVASMQRASFFPDDPVFNALSRRKHFEAGRRFRETVVPAEQWLDLRYEDLVHEPRATLETLCAFLGEPFEPAMLSYYEEASQYMKEEAATGFNANATRPVSTKRIDAWRDQLSADAVATVERICADEMRVFEYTPDGLRPTWVSTATQWWKTRYWDLKLWQHRSTRHYTVKYPILARSRARWTRRAQRLRHALSL